MAIRCSQRKTISEETFTADWPRIPLRPKTSTKSRNRLVKGLTTSKLMTLYQTDSTVGSDAEDLL